MSANTGMAFHTRIAVAVAAMLHGVTMTSAPGLMPAAPTAAISPDVAELTETACATPNDSAHASSNALTSGPPRNPSPHAPMYPESTPLSRTRRAAATSPSPWARYGANSRAMNGSPPSIASGVLRGSTTLGRIEDLLTKLQGQQSRASI